MFIRPILNPVFNVDTPDGKSGIQIKQFDVPDFCQEVIDIWKENPLPSRTHRTIHGKSRGRLSFDVKNTDHIKDALVESIIQPQVMELASHYNYSGCEPMINSNEILLYTPGPGCVVHCDDQDPADNEYGFGTTLFNWANQLVALLYLTTDGIDFEGGEIYFPNQSTSIKAQTGKLVVFPAHYKYKHGVTAITSGHRIALQTTWRFD